MKTTRTGTLIALLTGAAVAVLPTLAEPVMAQDVVTDEMLLTAQEDPNNWLMAIGKLASVIKQVDDYLLQAVLVANHHCWVSF